MTQAIGRGQYGFSVQNAARVPYEWLKTMQGRIDLAYDMGETPEMLAEELRFRYQHRPQVSKSALELARRVVRVP